jgi:hypothetical protein
MTVAVRSASPIPWIDDWDLVRPLTGDDSISEWLWRPYINHRVPLPRVFLLAIYKLNGADFRAGPVINVLVLATTALTMILATRRIRGRTAYSDAIFPLALLNIDDEVMFATLGVNLIPSTVLSCLVLLLLMRQSRIESRGTVLLIAILTLALGMCGSSGIAQVLPLAAWLRYVSIRQCLGSESGGKTTAFIASAAFVMLVLYTILYFDGLKEDREPDKLPGPKATIKTSLEFLSMAVGPAAPSIIPERFPPRPWIGVGVALAAMASVILLIYAWRRFPIERARSAGLLLFLAGMGLFALGVGWGRAGPEPGAGYAGRYTIYAAPILFAIYFAWDAYGPRWTARLVPMTLFVVLVVLFAPNVRQSLAQVRYHVRQSRGVERDLLAGSPPELLAERYKAFLLADIPEAMDHLPLCMRLLHRDGLGIFRELKQPEFRTLNFSAPPEHLHQIQWKDRVAVYEGNDPYMIYRLKQPMFVLGIRLHCRYEKPGHVPHAQLYWRNGDKRFSDNERTDSIDFETKAEGNRLLFLINAEIDHFRFDPDNKPGAVKIEAIELIVPQHPSTPTGS